METLFIVILVVVLVVITFKAMSTDDKNSKKKELNYKDYDTSKRSSPHPNDTQLGSANPTPNSTVFSRREQAYLRFEEQRLAKEEEEEKKENFIFCEVAGISYRPKCDIKRANKLYDGESLYLEEEPSNVYDKNAIKIVTDDNFFIGYIPAFLCTTVKEFIKEHPDYDVVVEYFKYSSSAPYINICIKYDI